MKKTLLITIACILSALFVYTFVVMANEPLAQKTNGTGMVKQEQAPVTTPTAVVIDVEEAEDILYIMLNRKKRSDLESQAKRQATVMAKADSDKSVGTFNTELKEKNSEMGVTGRILLMN
ncbi:hypothetical protein AB4Z45_27775 [Paenibacillus sp. MCAF9]|uniref:hypothetical protein n=1 Tax=Paenibacillus sp. MCAF9 TaxID=3233046 RepID=UPI003F96D389